MSTTIKRKWREQQKLAIIQEAQQNGVTETMRKHTLSHSLYRKWRKAYDGQGMQGLQLHYKTVDPAVRQLEVENQRLKNIIAKQALEIEFKDELLKKTVERPASQRMRERFCRQDKDQQPDPVERRVQKQLLLPSLNRQAGP